jgi:hypothetical protein
MFRNLWHLPSRNLKCPLILIRSSPMSRWYSMCCPVFLFCLHCTFSLQSSLHLVIFRHPYLTHMRSDFRNLKCYEFSTSFSSQRPFRIFLEEKNLAFNLWEDGIYFLWHLGLRFLLQSISIVRYKILQLEVGKYHIVFFIGPHVSIHITIIIGPKFTKMALKFEGLSEIVP